MQINKWTNPLKAITLCSLPTLKFPVKSPRKKLKKRSQMRFPDYLSTRKESFIKRFLQTREYPFGASYKDKKTLRRLSRNFFLNEDVLYKRNFDMVLLRCVDRQEADTIIHEVHEGSFGTHSNGHA